MVNCVEDLFEISENNGVDFTAVNCINGKTPTDIFCPPFRLVSVVVTF